LTVQSSFTQVINQQCHVCHGDDSSDTNIAQATGSSIGTYHLDAKYLSSVFSLNLFLIKEGTQVILLTNHQHWSGDQLILLGGL
jgi:hypothetical protein